MTKLHELLAVETNLKGQADKTRRELMNTFEKKRHLFEEKLVTFKPIGEGPAITETQSAMNTTITKELTWVSGFIGNALNAAYQIADANTRAKADVVLETGATLLKDIPATALLELEKRMTELQELITSIPTLDPAKGFTADTQKGEGFFMATPVRKKRTAKVTTPVVLYEATDKHPAQVQLVPSDVETGTIHEQEWSALMTPARKSQLLERVEILSRAVRAARSRANTADVNPAAKIASELLGYLFGA